MYSEEKLENQRKMKGVRAHKPIFTTLDYQSHSFGSSEDKTLLRGFIHELKYRLQPLLLSEKDFNEKTIEFGEIGSKLKSKLDSIQKSSKRRINVKKYLELHLGDGANRIYEAIAAYRAIENGAPKEANLTVLKELGAALESGNSLKKSAVIKWIAKECVPSGEPLSTVSVKEFRQALKEITNTTSKLNFRKTCHKLINQTHNAKSVLKDLLENLDSERRKNKEEVYRLKNELEEFAEMINQFISKSLPTTEKS